MIEKVSANTTVWIVEQNPLAAEYLKDIITKDRTLRVQWIQEVLPHKQEIGAYPVFIFDRIGFEPLLTDFLRSVSIQFEHARYIVIDKRFNNQQILELLSLGVQGLLRHDEVAESLRPAIKYVSNGRMWIEPELMQGCANPTLRVRQAGVAAGEDGITSREAQILELARQRFSNKEIAVKLNIEVSTVKFHLSNIFSKLQITSRSELWKDSALNLVTQRWSARNDAQTRL
jgi:DNA-binding NarL/FixJ family response regulator